MAKCFQCGGEHTGTYSCLPPEAPALTKNVLADEIIWATSTTGEDFQCVHADFAREQQAEIERLNRLLNPRLWTPEQDAAWHKAIPDLYKAFEVLRGAVEPGTPPTL